MGSNHENCDGSGSSGELEMMNVDVKAETDGEECTASTSKPQKLDLWKVIADKSKVIEAFYLEGNYYHDSNLQELSELAGTSHKNVRDALSRLRKRDEKAGRYVPPPPRQQYEFNEEQRKVLEAAFKKSRQLDADGTKELMSVTNLTPKQIGNWFCNQRRKEDGRSAEKDRKRRERLRNEMIKDGRGRIPTFTPDVVELFEIEYEKMKQLTEIGGQPAKFPYGMLVERTRMDRKKIRDWFAKRKLKEKRCSESRENHVDDSWKKLIDNAISGIKSSDGKQRI